MDRDTTVYVILTASFFLLFLVIALFLENRKKPIQAFPGKKIPLLMKIPWDTVFKGLAAAGFILFSRKLVYYVPFDGVIQTKFSIWWVEGKAQTLLIISILVFLVIGLGWHMLKRNIEEKMFGIVLVYLSVLGTLLFLVIQITSKGDLKIEFPITGRHLILIIFAPLVLLKMLFFGKYPGLLTGVLLGYFIVVGYKKLKKGTIKHHINMIAAGLMFLIFLGFSFYQSLGNWQEQFNHRVQSAESRGEIEELLDAVNTINDEFTKSDAIQRMAAAIAVTGDSQWKQETFQQAIRTTGAIESSKQKSKALKEIAVSIGKTGDIPWAIEVAMSIPAVNEKNNALKELQEIFKEK